MNHENISDLLFDLFRTKVELDEEEKKKKLTEISSHSECAVVRTHSNFDIRFLDEGGSPLEDEYLQVDVTVLEIIDFRTEEELIGDK